MSNGALVPQSVANLPAVSAGSVDYQKEQAQGEEFLSQLRFTSKGKEFPNGKYLSPGTWYLISPQDKDTPIPLGDEIHCLVYAASPKALDSTAKTVSFDETSDTYKDIQSRSSQKNSGCMAGMRFLISESTTGKLLELWCAGTIGLKSLYRQALPFMNLSEEERAERSKAMGIELPLEFAGQPFTLKSRTKTSKQGGGQYREPFIRKCSVPFTNVPSADRIVAEQQKFINEKGGNADGGEAVEESGAERAR
jgi:hypothetical protein